MVVVKVLILLHPDKKLSSKLLVPLLFYYYALNTIKIIDLTIFTQKLDIL